MEIIRPNADPPEGRAEPRPPDLERPKLSKHGDTPQIFVSRHRGVERDWAVIRGAIGRAVAVSFGNG